MKLAQTTVLVATPMVLLSVTPSFAECNSYSRLPSVEICTRESAKSPKAKREGYSLAGIRSWCEQWQPQCAPARKPKSK